jgi:ElaB/YqjD/DUF883 family membrane-anchored ribosome-binding protein
MVQFQNQARTMPDAKIRKAIRDIEDMLEGWGNRKSDYTEKLRAELQAYNAEMKNRAAGQRPALRQMSLSR